MSTIQENTFLVVMYIPLLLIIILQWLVIHDLRKMVEAYRQNHSASVDLLSKTRQGMLNFLKSPNLLAEGCPICKSHFSHERGCSLHEWQQMLEEQLEEQA